jgi:hypothetical protein
MTLQASRIPVAFCASLLFIGAACAQRAAKDVVLDQVAAPLLATSSPAARRDAMVVSVLLESPDGTLTPQSAERMFRTGERFRIKVLASREGRVSLYNTTPAGVFKPQPIWRADVRAGQETITPRLVLDGHAGAGVEQIHVVLEPAGGGPPAEGWFDQWLGKRASKDVRIDQQSTGEATYLLTDSGTGLLTTVRIQQR